MNGVDGEAQEGQVWIATERQTYAHAVTSSARSGVDNTWKRRPLLDTCRMRKRR